jgi:hypothetical protein
METRCCNKCDEVKHVNEFNKRQTMCKVCQSNYNKNYVNTLTGKANNRKAVKKNQIKGKAVYGLFSNEICLYIGQSKRFRSRKYNHTYWIKYPHKAPSSHTELYNLLQSYSNIDIRIIEECSPEALLQREQHYIDNYKPLYNIKLS